MQNAESIFGEDGFDKLVRDNDSRALRSVRRALRRPQTPQQTWNSIKFFLVWIGVITFCVAVWCLVFAFVGSIAQAEEVKIPEHLAVRAVIGEASNQGYEGMLAVACAIRNRGTLKGVYGLRAKHVNNQPKWVWHLARRAWRGSADRDVTNGASHWENIKAFGKPKWTKGMVLTYVCKDHYFYAHKRGNRAAWKRA